MVELLLLETLMHAAREDASAPAASIIRHIETEAEITMEEILQENKRANFCA